jgi:hypothetical protein
VVQNPNRTKKSNFKERRKERKIEALAIEPGKMIAPEACKSISKENSKRSLSQLRRFAASRKLRGGGKFS